MSKKIFLFSLFLSFSSELWARCNGGYADHLLARTFSCLKGEQEGDSIVSLTSIHKEASQEVGEICMSGCYDAMFKDSSPALKASCDRKYAKVLKKYFAPLKEKIMVGVKKEGNSPVVKCSEEEIQEKVLSDIIGVSKGADGCVYVGRFSYSKVFPEKLIEKDAKVCGTKASLKCMAEAFYRCDVRVECPDEFMHNGKKYEAATYEAYCSTPAGSCPEKAGDCLLDESIDQINQKHRELDYRYRIRQHDPSAFGGDPDEGDGQAVPR